MEEPILLVDDDPSLLAALQRQLQEGFKITLARSGNEALAAVSHANSRQEPFAVVVCDMGMPGMDGIEVLNRIRALSPDTVRIMLTGKADQQTAVDAINLSNVFRFFAKPCPAEKLAEGLHAALAQYRLVTTERDLMERLGYPRSKESPFQASGAPNFGGLPEMSGTAVPTGNIVGTQAEEERLKRLATMAETRKDIQDMVGYDIVNHDRLLTLAENIWRSVPLNKRAKYSVKDWQADIYDKCRPALVSAEKKLAENNPEPRLLQANTNILRSTFSRQVIRAMQEISEHYRDYHAKAQAKAQPK